MHDTAWNRAPYTNVQTVDVGRPLTPEEAMDYIMGGTATGKNGLAHDFHADTAEAAQHPAGDPDHIHAEGALLNTGLPIPGRLGGTMDGYRTGPSSLHLDMTDAALGFALEADVNIAQGASLHELIVTEEGVAHGNLPFEASAVALGHLKFFDAGARVAQGANQARGLAGDAHGRGLMVGFGEAVVASTADGMISTGGKLFVTGTVLDATLVGAVAGIPMQVAGGTLAAGGTAIKVAGKLGGWARDLWRSAVG